MDILGLRVDASIYATMYVNAACLMWHAGAFAGNNWQIIPSSMLPWPHRTWPHKTEQPVIHGRATGLGQGLVVVLRMMRPCTAW